MAEEKAYVYVEVRGLPNTFWEFPTPEAARDWLREIRDTYGAHEFRKVLMFQGTEISPDPEAT